MSLQYRSMELSWQNKSRPLFASVLFLAVIFLFLIMAPRNAFPSDVNLAWDPNQESDISGYRIYYGPSSGNYSFKVDVGNVSSYKLQWLEEGVTYYFAVSAYDSSGLESDLSNEVVCTTARSAPYYPSLPATLVSVDSQELAGENGAGQNALDGNPGTFWHSQWYSSSPACPHEIIVDLSKFCTVTGFTYLPRQDGGINGTVADYAFYLSGDGFNWGQPVAGGAFANDTQLKQVLFSPGLGRFARFVALSEVNGRPWTSMAELTVLGTPLNYTMLPQSQLRIVSADSQELVGENGAAQNAIDGRSDTFWHSLWYGSSPPCPHEIVIDLGGDYSVAGFHYLPRQDGETHGTIADYEFYVSTDGINWGPPLAAGTFQPNTSEKEVLFVPKPGHFIRLAALSEINGNPWTSAAEIGVLVAGN